MGEGNQNIAQVALAQEGNQGGQSYWSWYGFGSESNGVPALSAGVRINVDILKQE